MARLADLPEWEREHLLHLRDQAPRLEGRPWVGGPALSQRRVALISTAGLHRRDDRPFGGGATATEYRVIPADTPSASLVMGHISVNFDRSGFRQDPNLVFPLDRLNELAADGSIGSVADYHYSFMGAPFPPTQFEPKARELAGLLARDQVDAAILIPV
ncbi:MAG: selenoprotein B glycine/betaine/sarcosine/D-proline reductase [Burkholderiales bacterium RIFCSPHIGHO2_12_FULL_69_20]|nr:MAG: selenoprotein B glycine/betaine/sarcosine/D-proline reductase [Burkholderiales bacterium RIFCSPHIGHO2_12_FULL_69_20]